MMFLINPVFSVAAIITIIIIYIWLVRKELDAEWGDIRGGMFITLAEKAARIADKFPRHQISWKPDLLVPIEDPWLWAGSLLFIKDITYPSGSLFAFTIKKESEDRAAYQLAMNELLDPLKAQRILVNSAVIEDDSFLHGASLVTQTLRGGAFRPNALFLVVSDNNVAPAKAQGDAKSNIKADEVVGELARLTLNHEMGVILLRQHPQQAFGMQQTVNLWLRDKTPNWHLAMLIALQLQLNWEGKINLITVASDPAGEQRHRDFLEHLSDHARLPSTTELRVLTGEFKPALSTAPRGDVNIFGLSLSQNNAGLPLDFIREVSELAKSSCVFVIDSGRESALV